VRAAVLAVLVVGCCACPAGATSTLTCAAADDVFVALTIGSVPGLSVVGARIDRGDRVWSTQGEGTPIAVGQAFSTGEMLMVDFVDENFNETLIGLRVFLVTGEHFAAAGTLRFADSAHAVVCDEP